MPDRDDARPPVAILGAGPAGLMAAERLAAAGARVTLYDRMPSPARKLLMAGRGGLNLTHSEPLDAFLDRYGPARAQLAPVIRAFPPAALVAWAETLGQPTFIGSSGRIFPRAMKASPLLRAWLARLAALGVTVRLRHRWVGWDPDGALRFDTPAGAQRVRPAATVLALGGASWPRLGSDGAWTAWLPATPLRPANCGVRIGWSAHVQARFAGAPLKRIAASVDGRTVRGEAVVTATGLEGGAIYALSGALQDATTLTLDLRPDIDAAALAARLDAPRGGVSLANWLRRAGLAPVAIALVQEALRNGQAGPLSRLVKALPLQVRGPMGLDRAISTAGGLPWDAVDASLMLRARPGVFACGEMLDWEAPTGGYLLQACLATGAWAGEAARRWLHGLPGDAGGASAASAPS